MALTQPILEFDKISKSYPGVQALKDVSFGVREGSVHALLGENGAGKSTLLKALSGAHTPTSGSIKINGEPLVFNSTADAMRAGVVVIYQELHLVPEMTVAENVYLGHLPTKGGLVDKAELYRNVEKLLATLDDEIRPGDKVGDLSLAKRQMVEIAKALSRGAKTIAFDEPTSSLSARETQSLFRVIRELQASGHVILYVTHRMEEVYELCDSATVLRDGQHVKTFETMEGVTPDMIVTSMVGRELKDVFNYEPRPVGETVLSISGVEGEGVTESIRLEVKAGEVVGLFGLVGAGRSELLKLIYGATKKVGGAVSMHGVEVRISSPSDAIKHGILLCPEDRKKEGIIPLRSLKENINLSVRRKTAKGGIVDEKWESSNAQEKINQLRVKTPSMFQQIVNLSGGNQQKVILGRWLSEDVKVMLLDEPTRGIDVGARSEIYSIIYDLAKQGVAVLLVSSDLPEVLGISDRVLVMRQGKLSGELSRKDATPEATLRLALPISSNSEVHA